MNEIKEAPKVGQKVYYRGNNVGVVALVEGDLCFVDDGSGNDPDPFIWRFRQMDKFGEWMPEKERYNSLHEWR